MKLDLDEWIVGSLEDAEDPMGDVSIEGITKKLLNAARAVDFESIGGGNRLIKKTKEHLEAEEKLRGTDGDELKIAKRELIKQRRRYRARRMMQEMQKVQKEAGCQALFVKKGETVSDRQKWKEELERYSRNKYQDEEMSMKTRKDVDEWEERSRRQRGGTGESQEPRLTMSVIIQSRASSSSGKAVGVDGISAEILNFFSW